MSDGNYWLYQDPNASVECRASRCTIAIPQFTQQHDTLQVLDNPKQLFLSTHGWSTGGGPLAFRTTMAAEVSGDPHDYRDGFACLNVLDFATGMVFDIATNGHHVWAIYERLLLPGVTTPDQAFTEVVDLDIPTLPHQEHEVGISIDAVARRVEYYIDYELKLVRENIPAVPQILLTGFGLITLRPIANGRSTSCFGQGGTGTWGPFYVNEPGAPL